MSADILGALVDLMLADGPVAALVGTRVYGGEMPRSEGPTIPRKVMVLLYSSGAGNNDYVELTEPAVDMRCYGETPQAADEVRRAGHDVMKTLTRKVQSSVLLHRANQLTGPITFRDPDTDQPASMNSYSVLAAEQAIS